MKILLVFPLHSTNTGDKVILLGTENILKEAFGEVEFSYLGFKNESVNLDIKNISDDTDLIVVAGTPWFWEACHRSPKYVQLMDIACVEIKKVGLGLGSCYPLNTSILKTYIYPDMVAVEKGGGDWRHADMVQIQDRFGKFDLLFTRDPVAQELLKTAGLESYETVCPAVFAYKFDKPLVKNKPLLIFQNPVVGISSESCDTDFVKQYIDFQLALMDKYNMEVRTTSPVDSDWLRDVAKLKCEREDDGGVPYSTWIKTPEELLLVLKQFNPVISCRVHTAIPSRALGNLTYILPMDTRFLVATKIGVLPLWTYGYPLGAGIVDFDITDLDLDKLNAFTKDKIEEGRNLMIEKLRRLM